MSERILSLVGGDTVDVQATLFAAVMAGYGPPAWSDAPVNALDVERAIQHSAEVGSVELAPGEPSIDVSLWREDHLVLDGLVAGEPQVYVSDDRFLSPGQARELAALLVEAADRLDAGRPPADVVPIAVGQSPSTGSAVADHLAYLARQARRPNTIQARRDTLRRFEETSGVPLLEATREHVQAYLDPLVAPATKRVYLTHLRGFYEWAVDEGYLTVAPTRRVPAARLPRRLPRPISEADLSRALETAPPLIRTWLMLSAFAGLRACEIGPIRGEHVVRQGTPLLIIPEAKGGGSATVPLAPVLLAELDQWPTSGWLWKPDGPYHSIVVSRLVSKHFREQGIAATLHMGRHRFGTQTYIASDRDLRLTQEMLRHASPATTAVYTALDPHEGSVVMGHLPTFAQLAAPELWQARPAVLAEVVAYVTANPGASRNAVERALAGLHVRDAVRQALDDAVRAGALLSRSGPRRAVLYSPASAER